MFGFISFIHFARFEKVNIFFLPFDMCICIANIRGKVWVRLVVLTTVNSDSKRSPLYQVYVFARLFTTLFQSTPLNVRHDTFT